MAEPDRILTPPETSREIARLSQEAAEARTNSHRSAKRLLEVETVLAESKARLLAQDETLAAQSQLIVDQDRRLDRSARVMAAMQSSLSWRVTAPLRGLKRQR